MTEVSLEKRQLRGLRKKIVGKCRDMDYLTETIEDGFFCIHATRGLEVRYIKIMLKRPSDEQFEEIRSFEVPHNVKKEIWIKHKGSSGRINFKKIFIQ